MNKKHHIALALIVIFNLSSCSARKPEQSTVTPQPNTRNKQTTRSHGTVIEFENLVAEHGSETEAFNKILEAEMVVVDFYATWCPPCKNLAPNFVSAAEQLPSVLFVKIDAQQFTTVSKQYYVRSFPTLIFFHKGTKINTISGFRSQKALIEEITAAFKL